jgi:hypothetical protein
LPDKVGKFSGLHLESPPLSDISLAKRRQQIEAIETYLCKEEIPLQQCNWDMLTAWAVALSSHLQGDRVVWAWLWKDYALALSKVE